MRACWIGAILAVVSVADVMPAVAQSALDGPLAAPGAAPAQVPPAHATPKPHKAHHAAAKPKKMPAAPQDAAAPHPTPADAPAAHAAMPTDAFDYGMKWTGTSDGSAQTHYQNGLDGAFGTGAEVGMKLHF